MFPTVWFKCGRSWMQSVNGYDRPQRGLMNQQAVAPGRPANSKPVFFWLTVALLALLVLGGTAAALLLVLQAGNINRSGGWGWILVAGIAIVAITVVGSACALCSAVSLFRREPHRRVSIAIL